MTTERVNIDQFKEIQKDFTLCGQFCAALRRAGIPFETEFRFAKSIGRDWAADMYVLPNVLIEIEGGLYGKKKSRHRTGRGYSGDCRKYNAGHLLGYIVMRYTSDDLGRLDEFVEEIRTMSKR